MVLFYCFFFDRVVLIGTSLITLSSVSVEFAVFINDVGLCTLGLLLKLVCELEVPSFLFDVLLLLRLTLLLFLTM